MRLSIEQDFCIRPMEAQLLNARTNLRRRGFEVGIDENVTGGRRDEVCREVLATDIIKRVCDLERRQWRRHLGRDFREGGEGEKQGKEWEKAAHGSVGNLSDCHFKRRTETGAMLFQKFIELHRVHGFIAHGVNLAVVIAYY